MTKVFTDTSSFIVAGQGPILGLGVFGSFCLRNLLRVTGEPCAGIRAVVSFAWMIRITQRANETMVAAFYLTGHDWEMALGLVAFLTRPWLFLELASLFLIWFLTICSGSWC